MTAFQDAFVIFDAADIIGFAAQMNDWGSNIESAVSELRNALLVQGAQATELRGAVLVQTCELTILRDGLVLMEQRATGMTQFGNQAVTELDAMMQAFRAELVLSKAEQQQLRFQEAEALKTELRGFVAQVEKSFAAVEAAVRNLEASPPAPAAVTGQDPWWTRRDPWWHQGP